MWGNLIDIIVLIVLIFVIVYIVNKIAKTKGKRVFAFIAIYIILSFIVSPIVISIENHLCNFKTPESVFNFTHTGEIICTVEGKDSCMIAYSKGKNQYSEEYILKSENGYKIPYEFLTKSVYRGFTDYGYLNVHRVSGTNDYYITGSVNTSETPETIVNSKDEEIKYIVIDTINTEPKTIFFYDVVNDFSDDYYIKINDKTVYAK